MACHSTISVAFRGLVKAAGLVVVVLVSIWCPAEATFQPHTLMVKTCNTSEAGTVNHVILSFCDGESSCKMGPPNVYNQRAELKPVGVWNTLQVPLEYEPTTMLMTIQGTDAWCVEALMWDGGANLLGTGGKLFLDGNLGEKGCEYGVNIKTGWCYPCQSGWRVFNLPGSDDYKYEVEVKGCSASSTSERAQLSSPPSAPKIVASLCSESLCNETVGDTVDFNVTAMTTNSDSGRATALVPAAFNPVAMRLVNVGDVPWCAEEITFNDYALWSRNASPTGLELAVGDDRNFFNVQFHGIAVGLFDEDFSEEGNWQDGVKGHAVEVLHAVLVFAITAALTCLITYIFRRWTPSSPKGQRDEILGTERMGDEVEDDRHDEGDDQPLCKAYHHVSHHPPGGGLEPPPPRGTPRRVLLRDDSADRLSFDRGDGQRRRGSGETRGSTLSLWGTGASRILSRIGLGQGRKTRALSGFRDRSPADDCGSGVSCNNTEQPAGGRVKTDSTATITTTATAKDSSASSAPRLVSARAMSDETFVERFTHARGNNTASQFIFCAPGSSWDKRGSEFRKAGRGHHQITSPGGKAYAAMVDGVGSANSRGRLLSNDGCEELRGTEECCSLAGGESRSPSTLHSPWPAPSAWRRALSETSPRNRSRALPSGDFPLPV